jgi:hypothetical protein
MKRILFLAIIIISFSGCKKGDEFKPAAFPGYSGNGEYGTWTVFKHTVTDAAYLTSVLPTQVPATTLTAYDASLLTARYKEVSPFSLRLYKNGEVAVIEKDAANQNVWVKKSTLKWENAGDQSYIYRNVNNNWVNVIVLTPDLGRMVCKYKRAFYGDVSSNQNIIVMEVICTIYRYN